MPRYTNTTLANEEVRGNAGALAMLEIGAKGEKLCCVRHG